MKTERKIKKICDEMEMPERSAVYPSGVSSENKERAGVRFRLDLVASAVVLIVMVFAVVIGQGLIRKDYVEPGVTGENSGTADDTMVIDVPKQGDDSGMQIIDPSVINDECWDVRGPGWEAPGIGSANKQITRMDVKTEIDPDEIDDGKPRPLVPHRGILANVADDELVPFMFVVSDVSKTVDKIHESLYMETEKILAGLLAKKLSITDELAWEYVEKKPIPSRYLLYPDLFLEENPEEEDREKFFERHVTFEVQQAIDEIQETDEYKIAVSAVYRQEEYLNKLESETAALRKKMADIEKTLAEKGFKLIWDLDDEEWTATLTYCGAVCVAAGTREQIFSLADEALNGARPGANGLPRLYYAIRNPLTTSEILGAPAEYMLTDVHSIIYESGGAFNGFTSTPRSAMAGDTVEIRTEILYDADIHVYVDGQEIEKSHYDSDYWGYSFVMPDKDVTVTSRFYTKDEMLSLDPVPAYESKVAYANWTDSEKLLSCLNADKLTLDSEPHVPVFRFDTKGDLDKFRETFGDVLTFTYGYDEVPSFDEATAKYDDGFFAGHTVVLAYVGAVSGSYRFGIGDISVNGSKLCLHIDDLRKDLQEETCDLAGWLVMAEFADADIAGITDFDAVMGYVSPEVKDPVTEEGDDAELAEFDWTYWQERQVEKEKEYGEANLIMHATPYMESFHPVGISWVINNSPFVVYRVVFYHYDPDTQTESEVYISKETGEFSITIDDFDYDSLWRDDIDIRLNEISFEIQGRKEGSPDGDWYSTRKCNFFPPEWLERKHAAYPEIYGDGKEDPETASIGLYRIYDGHEDDYAWKYYWEIPQAILSQGEVYGRCLIIDEDGQTIYTTQVEKYIEFDDFDARFPYPIRNPNTSENPNSFIFTIEEIEEISERCVKDPKNLKIAVEISHGQSFEQSRISEEQLTGMVVLYREVYLLNHRSQTADRPVNE